MKLTKNQALFKDALDEAAAELGLVGEFIKGHRHDKYRIVLNDAASTVLTLPVYSTPKTADGYVRSLRSKLRDMIVRHCERKGVT